MRNIEETRVLDEIYLVYYDTQIHFAGTKEEAEKIRDEKKEQYSALKWQVGTVEEYGDFCWSEGNDSGYEQGCSEHED